MRRSHATSRPDAAPSNSDRWIAAPPMLRETAPSCRSSVGDLVGVPGREEPVLLRQNSCCTRATARRQATASSIVSCVSAWPPGPSMMAAATSFEAISAYSGEVLACAQYASLKRPWSMALLPSRMWIHEVCDSAASSLCVECVANTVGPSFGCSAGSPRIAKRSRYIGLKRA